MKEAIQTWLQNAGNRDKKGERVGLRKPEAIQAWRQSPGNTMQMEQRTRGWGKEVTEHRDPTRKDFDSHFCVEAKGWGRADSDVHGQGSDMVRAGLQVG